MAPALLAMLPAILKGGIGLAQSAAGAAGMFGLKRPKYQIPASATESLGIAREMSKRMEMPGEAAARARLAQQAANTFGQSQQYGMAGLATLPAIMAQQMSGDLNLASQSAAWRTQQQQALMAQLGQFAQYEDQAWQMNKFAPYQDRLQRYQNLIGSGIKNVASGADTAMMTMVGLPDLFQNTLKDQFKNAKVNYMPSAGGFSLPYLSGVKPRKSIFQ